MIDFIMSVSATYAVTFVIASSSLFAPFRNWLIPRTPWLKMVDAHPHFIECRMCVGFWAACGVVALTQQPLIWILSVYGASYFLSTQER